MAPIRKTRARGTETLQNAAHDGLGENVEEVCAYGQDALDSCAHQGRGDDEPAARADTSGYESRTHADEDGNTENIHAVIGWAVGFLAADGGRQRLPDFVGESPASQNDREQQQSQKPDPFPVAQNDPCVLYLPPGEGA